MMKRLFAALLFTTAALAQTPAERVAADAAVVDRVAEASKRDLPAELLERIVNEDIELLRGRRPDGTYEYASYERFEGGRIAQEFSIQPRKDRMATVELKGENIYRAIIDVPSRRLLVRKNRPIWIERVDVEFMGEGSGTLRHESFEVKAWLQPGENRPVDLPVIARQATVKLIATVDEKGGYGNVELALVQARIVDNANSPYAEGVAGAKAMLRALGSKDVPSLRSAAQRTRDALGAAPAARSAAVTVVAAPPEGDHATRVEMQAELQLIEDLLTGSESERREGLDRLHQMIRRLR